MTASSPLPEQPLPRNHETEQIHQREVFWQIYAPMLGALLVVVGLGTLAVTAAVGGGTVVSGLWANISLVFIIAQLFIVILPLLILFAALSYLLQYLLGYLPPYFKIAQDFMGQVALQSKIISGYIMQPMQAVKEAGAALQEILNQQMKRGGTHGTKH